MACPNPQVHVALQTRLTFNTDMIKYWIYRIYPFKTVFIKKYNKISNDINGLLIMWDGSQKIIGWGGIKMHWSLCMRGFKAGGVAGLNLRDFLFFVYPNVCFMIELFI